MAHTWKWNNWKKTRYEIFLKSQKYYLDQDQSWPPNFTCGFHHIYPKSPPNCINLGAVIMKQLVKLGPYSLSDLMLTNTPHQPLSWHIFMNFIKWQFSCELWSWPFHWKRWQMFSLSIPFLRFKKNCRSGEFRKPGKSNLWYFFPKFTLSTPISKLKSLKSLTRQDTKFLVWFLQ